MACFEVLLGVSIFYMFKKEQGSTTWVLKVASSCITNHKTSGVPEVQTAWHRCLPLMHSNTYGENQTQHINCRARRWEGDDLGLFRNHRALPSCTHSVNHKLPCVPTYCSQECEAICLIAFFFKIVS